MNDETPTTKYVTVTATLVFVGDYYDAEECQRAALGWINGALDDRDDLRRWTASTQLCDEKPGDPEGLLP